MKLVRKFVGGAILLITTTLLAQPAGPVRQADDSPIPSAADMVRRVPVLVNEAIENHGRVTLLQLGARQRKDVIKLNCINEKLLQLKAVRNILDVLKVEFDSAGDATRETIFNQIVDNVGTARKLREEAQICAGEVELYSEFKNDYTGPDVPDDPGKDLFPGELEAPGYASPYN